MTSIDNQMNILSSFYLNYRDDSSAGDFFEFNDIGLPLAFLAVEGLCHPSEVGLIYIQETFNILLATLGVEDNDYDSLESLLATAEQAGK